MRQEAPGDLELVRDLINSWLIPNDTRSPTDRFAVFASEHGIGRGEAERVRQLRDDLRAAVDRAAHGEERVEGWIREHVQVRVVDGRLRFGAVSGAVGRVLLAVVNAMAEGTWPRLKACPDCRWVFFDHSRNASKRWCLMAAGGSGGRSCGSIAKVRRYRQRHR
jgi:hypothetical protein